MAAFDIRMKELRIPGQQATGAKATLTVNADTAFVVRKIASTEGRSRNLTDVVDDMIRAYIAAKHPDWSLIVATDAEDGRPHLVRRRRRPTKESKR